MRELMIQTIVPQRMFTMVSELPKPYAALCGHAGSGGTWRANNALKRRARSTDNGTEMAYQLTVWGKNRALMHWRNRIFWLDASARLDCLP